VVSMKVNLEQFSLQLMERNTALGVLTLIWIFLIIAAIIILFAAIMYFFTVPMHCIVICSWPSMVGVVVGGMMIGVALATRDFAKKLESGKF